MTGSLNLNSPILDRAIATRLDAARANNTDRLKETAAQLEGIFVRQLFAAMRETVPTDGITHGGAGEEMFTAMMHEHIADELPSRWDRGIGAQVLAELRRTEGTPSQSPERP